MSRRFTYSFAAVVIALFLSAYVIAGGADDEQTPKPAATGVKDLNERIVALEARVAALDELAERVAALERLPTQTIIRSHQAPPAITESLPPGWEQREFNGLPYYLVPLTEQNPPPAAKLAPLEEPAKPPQPAP